MGWQIMDDFDAFMKELDKETYLVIVIDAANYGNEKARKFIRGKLEAYKKGGEVEQYDHLLALVTKSAEKWVEVSDVW